MNLKRPLVIVFFFLLILIGGYVIYTKTSKNIPNPYSIVQIGDAVVKAEVESTPQQREKGLSGRTTLEKDHGMLFVFPNKDKHGFWMKDMNFPIDMIWVDTDRVVYIQENAPTPLPNETLPIYVPTDAANLVLEVPAGYTREHGIVIGSKVKIQK